MDHWDRTRRDGPLTIRTEQAGDLLVVRVFGELGRSTAETFEFELRLAISGDASTVVLDLAGLGTIDSTGLRSVVRIANQSLRAGGRLECGGHRRPSNKHSRGAAWSICSPWSSEASALARYCAGDVAAERGDRQGVHAGFEQGDRESWREYSTQPWSGIPRRADARSGVYHGHDGIEEFFRDWLGTWRDFEIANREFIDAGDLVVVVFGQTGTGRSSGSGSRGLLWRVRTEGRQGRSLRVV